MPGVARRVILVQLQELDPNATNKYRQVQKKFLTKEQALQKLKHYCTYQERSHYEVEQKLWDLGIKKADHDEIISKLIEEDYLNEERFAIQFAGCASQPTLQTS